MKISIKAYDNEGKQINTPSIISFRHYIGRFGVEETFTFYFAKKVSENIAKVIVSRSKKKDVECFVDSIVTETTKNGLVCKLKIKNKLCQIFEDQLQPTQFKDLTLATILEKYAKKYDITNSIKKFNKKDISKFKAREFYIDVGMTAWDALQLFYENMCMKDVFLNQDKQLTFPYSPKTPLYFGKYKNYGPSNINGIDYISFKKTDDRSKLISDSYVKLIDDDTSTEFKKYNDKNLYTLRCGIVRTKYSSVPKQWQILPEYGSDYIIRKENKKRYKFELSTFENIEAYPGMKGRIKELDENEDLCVMEVYESFEDCGNKTKIVFRSNVLE